MDILRYIVIESEVRYDVFCLLDRRHYSALRYSLEGVPSKKKEAMNDF
jgi:hypothetical protein